MRLLGGIIVCQKVHEFNDMIRKLRKELFEKNGTNSYCFAENMAIATLYGNLTPTENLFQVRWTVRKWFIWLEQNDSRSVCCEFP